MGLVLRRFAASAASVTVAVAERGEQVVSHSVRTRGSPAGEVVEEVADEHAYAAVERAVQRTARSVERALRRRGDPR
jgi:ribosome-associated translation inhibitor RaiA